jgi:hypothetical protein
MKTRTISALVLAAALSLAGTAPTTARQVAPSPGAPPSRPEGPCDIYAAAAAPCVAAHSTTRALFASYDGPLYQVVRQSDGKTLDIGVVQPVVSPAPDRGGYANAAAQDAFCAGTYCFISVIYDQSPMRNHLVQAPRGFFSGPAMGGFNNLPPADLAPVTLMGHKVYGVFIAPGMGLRQNDARGTAVDDQAEGQYWVINGHHYNSGCCFDYGNAETDSRDDGNGTMETTYYGNAPFWYRGSGPGPWIMTDQENNLVGCVNADGSKVCHDLPSITWRFVTAMAKGEPHHWTSLGGDAQRGPLKVMFDGPRIDFTYDPMRKQGAILLGNGGDNSVGSQGTFYEGAMTAAGTFPSDATDQLVQANIVAAKYDVPRVAIAPASVTSAPTGLQTFAPGTSQQTTVTFTNVSDAPVSGVTLSLVTPKQWTATAAATGKTMMSIAEPIAPGATVGATFRVTAGARAFNGDLVARATWTPASGNAVQSETAAQKVRNVSPVKINEFRVSAGLLTNPTDAFVELYNAGSRAVDISNWTLTQHQTEQAPFSSIRIPPGTRLPSNGFYLLGLSSSGLAAAAHPGDGTVHVRSVAGMTVGDTVTIGTGSSAETRTIATLGTAAGTATTLWQPLPDGPVITVPVGSTNVPVASVAGFAVGQKIGIGHGATYPATARVMEQYEVATVTAVGKPGTQAFLGADAPVGATNIKVTSVAGISAGDEIRLDIDTVGHGIETVKVTKVGTASIRGVLAADAGAGATTLVLRVRGGATGLTVGDRMTVGTPANQQVVTITAVGAATPTGTTVDFTPALAVAHRTREDVVAQGTGLELAAPLKFMHAANMPFSARGTGISFTPATAYVHSSNEPVQGLGTGITLDRPLARAHPIDAVVHDANARTAGYQGTPAPHQWFGGPVLSNSAGAMVLREATGLVVDSLNYGLLVDPWASEGYQGRSGFEESGCRVPTPGTGGASWPPPPPPTTNTPHKSAGRFPDGADTDSNCADFRVQAATTLSAAAAAGTTNVKVGSVAEFSAGQTLTIDAGAHLETAVVASVGTAGASISGAPTALGATAIPVIGAAGIVAGQTIDIDTGGNHETAVVSSIGRVFGPGGPGAGGPPRSLLNLTAPLTREHAAGVPVSGTGITLTHPLSRSHEIGTQVGASVPTPGGPNKYDISARK